jgi:hypothetical protein
MFGADAVFIAVRKGRYDDICGQIKSLERHKYGVLDHTLRTSAPSSRKRSSIRS